VRYTLRPATWAEFDFLFELRVQTMKEYVEATWGWDQADQLMRFKLHFDPRQVQIIELDGRDVGELGQEAWPSHLYLNSLYILPAYQRRGLGTAILQEMQRQATAAGLPIRLQVLRVNPARRLYERLGFVVTRETTSHYEMEWTGAGEG
jgi:ribosomal protein S18 acetylase RimI-like enzyme